MYSNVETFLFLVWMMGITCIPLFSICVHFALKKHGNFVKGIFKKIIIGLLCYLLWITCYFFSMLIIKVSPIGFAQPYWLPTWFPILGSLAIAWIVPAFIISFALEKLGLKFTSEETEKGYWRKVGISTYMRFATTMLILLVMSKIVRNLIGL